MPIRILDFILATAGIICGSPVFIAVFIAGVFDTGSPLFLQQRVGRNQKPFTLIKFRTMAVNTAAVATHLADANAVTKLGSFLRRTKLDELPQLLNVLTGQMSLVGPRPCLPSQKELISEREKRGVFALRPGITGLAQVNEVDMSTPRKLARYDKLLMERLNLGVYFQLLFATAFGKGSGDRVRTEDQKKTVSDSPQRAD